MPQGRSFFYPSDLADVTQNAFRMTTRLRRIRISLLGLWAAAVLSGCESSSVADKVLDDKALKPPPSVVEETFGRGSTEVTVLLTKAPNGIYEGAARDIRDGAALAIGELDDAGVMKIKVIDVAGGAAAVAPALAAARARNSGLLISYAPQATTAAIAAIPADQRPPLINLSSPVAGANVFNFGFDEVASVARGVRPVIASGHKRVVVLTPNSIAGVDEERLRSAVGQAGGALIGVVRYDPAAPLGDLLTRNKALLDDAGALVLMGDSAAVGTILKGVRASFAKLAVVGTSHWPIELYADPAASNVIIAAADPDASLLIGERYRRFNKRSLSVYAAEGYDSIAVAAGIVRGKGATALTPEALTTKTGFRGVTGLFRFTPGGMTERKIGLYKIDGGRLVAIEPKAVSF
ncbi:ABC-type branched-chain amino acid transport system, periplasmic component [Neorhizobium galegae bv. officinalis]|nr:ABC-type branched-chain amino acid transport system, periplasmic component [Neorhizobium galegae bv. officinalis]